MRALGSILSTARITVEDLHHRHAGKGRAGGETETLSGLDFTVEAGEVLGIVGPSGCGKSTLLGAIAGLERPQRGRIAIAGENGEAERLRHCALMPQQDLLLPWYDVLDNAGIALRNRGLGHREARQAAAAHLERFGLAGFETALPKQLSGGMRQRVAFLRTLLAEKPVLLLDEPFAALDAITRADMQRWLAAALEREPRTTVLVTHDVEEALYLADRVVVLTPRPARIQGSLTSPDPRRENREAAIADPDFVAARRGAMEMLAA
jgi:ABC-type nitrate/sulfonate/bicarbonate transport system ATPase subunit